MEVSKKKYSIYSKNEYIITYMMYFVYYKYIRKNFIEKLNLLY